MKYIFFGGEPLAHPILETLRHAGYMPSSVVTSPDRQSGRGMRTTAPPAKRWAEQHEIPVLQPERETYKDIFASLMQEPFDVCVVAGYPSILPIELLNHPAHGSLNVHPSLLPQLRGPSPIRSAILNDMRETGVTIMHMDAQMDHGPIVAQKHITIPNHEWPMRGRELDARLAHAGGALLVEVIPRWLAGTISETPQIHRDATYTRKFTKEDGELDLADDPYQNVLKFCAFDGWPGTYFFIERNGKRCRIKVTDARLGADGSFEILRVVPEGKKEIDYTVFLQSHA